MPCLVVNRCAVGSRLSSVNICHSGASEWGAIAAQHVPRLRRLVQQQFGSDIYDNTVAWFPDLEFCEKNGIPVMFGVQRAGDIVVLDGKAVSSPPLPLYSSPGVLPSPLIYCCLTGRTHLCVHWEYRFGAYQGRPCTGCAPRPSLCTRRGTWLRRLPIRFGAHIH